MIDIGAALAGMIICVGIVVAISLLIVLLIWWMMRNGMEWEDIDDWDEL